MTVVAITGNTYPVKDRIKALGGRWDAGRKAWMVAADKEAQARAIVASAPQSVRPRFSRAERECPRFGAGHVCPAWATHCWYYDEEV